MRDLRTNPFQQYPRVLAQLPRIVRLYIFHTLIGFAISAAFTAFILWSNFANIGHLVTTVQGGWLAAAVFFVLNGIVFAGVQTGIVIMSLGDDDGSDAGGHRPGVSAASEVRPILVRGSQTTRRPH